MSENSPHPAQAHRRPHPDHACDRRGAAKISAARSISLVVSARHARAASGDPPASIAPSSLGREITGRGRLVHGGAAEDTNTASTSPATIAPLSRRCSPGARHRITADHPDVAAEIRALSYNELVQSPVRADAHGRLPPRPPRAARHPGRSRHVQLASLPRLWRTRGARAERRDSPRRVRPPPSWLCPC